MEWLLLVGVAPLKHAYDYSIYAGRRNATIFAWEMRMGIERGALQCDRNGRRGRWEGCAPARPHRGMWDFSKGFVFFKKQYTLINTARNCCDLSMGAKWFRLPRQIAGGMQRMIVGLFNHRSKK